MSVLFWMYDLLLMHCFKLRVIVIFLAWLGLTKLVTQTIRVKRFMAALCNCVLGFLLLSSIYLSVCLSVCLSLYLSLYLSIYLFSFFSLPNLSHRRLHVCHYFYTWYVAYCKFRMQVSHVLHAARWKCSMQKLPKIRHLHTIGQLCRAMSSQLRHILTIGKNFLNSNISPICPHNMVNFGPQTAEIHW